MRALVTGGGGFLGGAIARALAAQDGGAEVVTSFSRGAHPQLAEHGVRHVSGDLADADAVDAAVRGHDTIFHVAAKAGVWGAPSDYRRANVDGTQNVLAAARRRGGAPPGLHQLAERLLRRS